MRSEKGGRDGHLDPPALYAVSSRVSEKRKEKRVKRNGGRGKRVFPHLKVRRWGSWPSSALIRWAESSEVNLTGEVLSRSTSGIRREKRIMTVDRKKLPSHTAFHCSDSLSIRPGRRKRKKNATPKRGKKKSLADNSHLAPLRPERRANSRMTSSLGRRTSLFP